MKYQKDGIVYNESKLRENLLEMGYNDYDFEEKVEELGYKFISELKFQSIKEEVNQQNLLLEEAINEGFFEWSSYKVLSFSAGILSEKQLDNIFMKAKVKLTPAQKKQFNLSNLSKKEKLNRLRNALKKGYEDKQGKKIIEKTAKNLKSEVKKIEEQKSKTLNEFVFISLAMIGGVIGSLIAGLLFELFAIPALVQIIIITLFAVGFPVAGFVGMMKNY
jgi:hypothetical protein